MNELISFNFDTQTVSARELHCKLNIGTRFNDWFPRMCEYGFEEEIDFYSKMSKTSEQTGRPQKDYEISIDMAKQICMIQRTEEGKQVRQYLIDLEKAWNTPEQVFARALKMADATINSLKQQMVEMKPKADYFDALVDRKLNTNVRDTAKGIGIKEREFVSFLISNGYCFIQGGKLRPYAQYCISIHTLTKRVTAKIAILTQFITTIFVYIILYQHK